MIIDPGLYLNKKRDIFFIPQRRSLPTAFKLFTGEYVIHSLAAILKGPIFSIGLMSCLYINCCVE